MNNATRLLKSLTAAKVKTGRAAMAYARVEIVNVFFILS
jgi:hypothetical protein